MGKEDDMLDLELRARFDEVRLAMERVRSGRSDSEQIWLPSGETVFIRRDASAPIGIRIQTPFAPMERRPRYRSDSSWGSSRPGPRIHGPAEEVSSGDAPSEADGPGDSGSAMGAAPRSKSHASFGGSRGHKQKEPLETRGYPAADERPPDYPTDLPFLPRCAVSVSASRSPDGARRTRSAVWADPPEPSRTLEELKAQLRAAGWKEAQISQASTYMGRTFSSSFQRGGATRVLSLVAFGEFSQILLFEKPRG